jgi:outer membrane lipoprotein-sorting protein
LPPQQAPRGAGFDNGESTDVKILRFPPVGRHCEQSEAIQTQGPFGRPGLDCFAIARNDGDHARQSPIRATNAFLLPAIAALFLLGFSLANAQDAPIDLHAGAAKSAKVAKSAPKAAPASVSAADAVRRANSWFESAHFLNADFVQVAPDGKRSEGKLYVERPGRMLFRFDPPARLEIVADGRSVAVRDQKLNTQDLYFIGQTPLKFLLSDHVDLARDTRVTGVASDAHSVTIDIEDKATLGGSANISLVFDPATFALKQWTVSDAQGFQTVVSLFNLDLTTQPDANLFAINEALTTSGRRN